MYTKLKNLGLVGGLIVSCLGGPSLRADVDSFSVLAFRPQPGHGPYLNLNDTRVDAPGDYHLELLFDYGRTLFKNNFAGTTSSVSQRMLTGHLLFDVNATHFLQLGLDMPLNLYNEFHDPTNGFTRQDNVDIGDLLFMLKGELLDPTQHTVGLAVVPYVTIPTGNGRTLTGTNQINPGIKLALEKKWGKASLAGNVGYLYHKDINRFGVNIDDMLTFDVGAAFRFPHDLTLSLAIDGRTVLDNAFDNKTQTPVQGVVTLQKDFRSGLSLKVGGGAGIIRGVGAPVARGLLGLACTSQCFKPKNDQDGDGISDDIDQCPEVVGGRITCGCPDSDIKFRKGRIETPTLYFETGSATLQRNGQQILNLLAADLKIRPKIKAIRVEGHTDNVGGRAYNLLLSKKRAQSVKAYLESKGVTASLEAEGYGFDHSIDSNDTAEGRERNRRVDFIILEK